MVDFMNPSEDLLAGLEAGRNEIYPQLDEAIQRAEQAENKLASLEQLLIECDECKRFTHHIGTGEAVCPYCERDKLQAVVDKLPKTMDGVGIMPDTTLYHWYDYNGVVRLDEIKVGPEYQLIVCINGCWQPAHINMWCCYSTKQAAEEAMKNETC